MPFDLRATIRRKPSNDSTTVECWRCGGNHWYKNRKTGSKCEAEPTYDAERQKRFQSEHKEGEQKSLVAAAGIQQFSFAAVAAGGGVFDSEVRALKQSNEKILAELQAQRALSDSLLKRFEQIEKVMQAAAERALAAEKAAQEASQRAVAAEKRAEAAGKRAEAAETGEKIAAEKLLTTEKRLTALEKKATDAEKRMGKLEGAIAEEKREIMGSIRVVTDSFAQRESDFIQGITADLEGWQKEWERKFAVVRKVLESKQGKATEEAAASKNTISRPPQSSAIASASTQPSVPSQLTPRKRNRSPSLVTTIDSQDKTTAKHSKTPAASISS